MKDISFQELVAIIDDTLACMVSRVVSPDVTPFRYDISYYATFFLSTGVLNTVEHPLNTTSPLTRHATSKSWHYLATSVRYDVLK